MLYSFACVGPVVVRADGHFSIRRLPDSEWTSASLGKSSSYGVEIGPKNITLHGLSHGRPHLRLRCAATLIRPGLLWKMYRAFAIRIVGTRQIGCEARPSQNEPCGAAWATRCRFHAPIEIPQEQVSNTGIPVERSSGRKLSWEGTRAKDGALRLRSLFRPVKTRINSMVCSADADKWGGLFNATALRGFTGPWLTTPKEPSRDHVFQPPR